MAIRFVAFIACTSVIVSFGAQAQDKRSMRFAPAFTTPGKELVCKKADRTPCDIRVSVRAAKAGEGDGKGCIASIEYEFIKIKKQVPFWFKLQNVDVGSTETYQFVSQGVIWDGGAPVTDELEFLKLEQSDTVAAWTSNKKKSPKDLAFLPLVKRSADSRMCDSIDPRIANDG